MDPIAYGVFNGALELIGAGLDATKEEEKQAAKRLFEGKSDLIKSLAGDTEKTKLFLSLPEAIPFMANLKKTNNFQFLDIMTTAMKDSPLNEVEKATLEKIKNSPTFAKNYLLRFPNAQKDNPLFYQFAMLNGALTHMSPSQNTTFNSLTSKPLAVVENYMKSIYPLKTVTDEFQGQTKAPLPQYLNDNLYHALNSWIDATKNQDATVELTDSNITNIMKAVTAPNVDEDQVLKIVGTFESSNLDKKSKLFLNMIKKTYGTQKGVTDLKSKIVGFADTIKNIKGSIENESIANFTKKSVKDILEKKLTKAEITKLESFAGSPNKTEADAYKAYASLVNFNENFKLLNKKDSKSYVYGNVDLSTLTGTKDPIADPKITGLAYLQRVNGKFVSGELSLDTFGDDETNRANFVSDIKSILQAVHSEKTSTKIIGEGANAKAEKGLPYNFNVLIPELMKVPEINQYVRDVLGLSDPGQDQSYVMPPQVTNGVNSTALPENQVKLDNGVIYQLSQETINFANRKNMKPVELFKDKAYRNMLLNGDGATNFSTSVNTGNDGIFKTINNLSKSGIIIGDSDISDKNAKKLARFFVLNNISEEEQYDIVAALKSEKLPSAWANTEPYTSGVSPSALELGSKQLAGQAYDVKKLPQVLEANEAFKSEIQAAMSYMTARPGSASQLVNDVYQFVLNQVYLKGSTLDVVNDNISNLINSNTVAGDTAEERTDELNALNQRFDKIMRSDFAINNAKLNSVFVSLAYNYARTKDPNGRISDADFKFAYNALRGGYTTTEPVSLAVLQDFLDEATYKSILLNKVNEHFSRYMFNNNTVAVEKSNIRGLRALKDFKKVSLYTRQVQAIKDYVKKYNINPAIFNNANTRYIGVPTELKKVNGDSLLGVYELHIRDYDGSSSPLAGSIPLYIDEDGKPLTLIELNNLRAN